MALRNCAALHVVRPTCLARPAAPGGATSPAVRNGRRALLERLRAGLVFGLLALGLSIGIVLAPMNLIYRDVSRFLMIATTLWLFLTPVFYAPPAEGVVAAIMRWNPVTPFLSMARSSALGEYTGDLIPGALLALGAGVLLLASWVVFRVALPSVLERSNA